MVAERPYFLTGPFNAALLGKYRGAESGDNVNMYRWRSVLVRVGISSTNSKGDTEKGRRIGKTYGWKKK